MNHHIKATHDVDDREKESGMVIDANAQPSLRGCAL
jgi:hypothetical protein